ncbi:MAG: CBS domain-containing protein [Actinomycetota bacterium]
MDIGPLISDQVLSVGPQECLADAARKMHERRVGSAVVIADDGSPGILTERDVLRAVAEGADPQSTHVEGYMTPQAITASLTWDAIEAGRRLISGGFRHLIVVDEEGSVAGVLSIRDLLRGLLDTMPQEAGAGASTTT